MIILEKSWILIVYLQRYKFYKWREYIFMWELIMKKSYKCCIYDYIREIMNTNSLFTTL